MTKEDTIHQVSLATSCLKMNCNEGLIAYSSYEMNLNKDNVRRMFRAIADSEHGKKYRHVIAAYRINGRMKALKTMYPELDIRLVSFGSDDYIKAVMTAKYLISDGRMPTYYTKRDEQVHLNLIDHKHYLTKTTPKEYKNRFYTKLRRTIAQSSFVTCKTDTMAGRMNRMLFTDSFFPGKMILSSEPASLRLGTLSKVAAAEALAAMEETAEESTAKYTPEAIKELKAKYAQLKKEALAAKKAEEERLAAEQAAAEAAENPADTSAADGAVSEEKAAASVEMSKEEGEEGKAKYSEELIKELSDKYGNNADSDAAPAQTDAESEEHTEQEADEDELNAAEDAAEDAGEQAESLENAADEDAVVKEPFENILGALFGGESEYIERPADERKKLLFLAFLGGQEDDMLILKNLIERIDREQYAVTVLAVKTKHTILCDSFPKGVRVMIRNDYVFKHDEVEAVLAESGCTAEEYYRLEVLRSLGTDEFDGVTVYGTANPFWHNIAAQIKAKSKVFAAKDDESVFGTSNKPDELAELIRNTYTKFFMISGESTRLEGCGTLPTVYNRVWPRLVEKKTGFTGCIFEDRNYIVLIPNKTTPVGCMMIPAMDYEQENIFAAAADADDGARIKAAFDRYHSSHPDSHLFINVLNDWQDCSGLCSEDVTAFSSARIPLMLLAKCVKFVCPYEDSLSLNALAAVLGLSAGETREGVCPRVLLTGPEDSKLYRGFRPAPLRGAFSADADMFTASGNNLFYLEEHEQAAYDFANNKLFDL